MSESNTPTTIVRDLAQLRAHVQAWKTQDRRIALVPTMGALHDGHMSLVRLALSQADRVVVSIFVNPTQFGPQEDFDDYPRQEADDITMLTQEGTHLAFIPSAEDMYPQGFATNIRVGGLTEDLCGAARPGHFDGVATVVAKLLLQCAPHIAVFGQKDYQQFLMIKQLVRDLDIPVEIIGAPTAREEDGLAISSRNQYLTAEQRRVASSLNRILLDLGAELQNGLSPSEVADRGRAALLKAGFDQVDYVEARDSETLRPISTLKKPARLLAAARLGKTRLIDNREIKPG